VLQEISLENKSLYHGQIRIAAEINWLAVIADLLCFKKFRAREFTLISESLDTPPWHLLQNPVPAITTEANPFHSDFL
jgi:hypothetical protein